MEKAQSLDERGLKVQRSVMKWQSMKVVNLVNHCKERGLTSTGSRAVLIQRLQDYENNDNFAHKIPLLKSSDIESNTDDDFEIEEVSVDGHDIANDSGCPTSDSEEVHYRLRKNSNTLSPIETEVTARSTPQEVDRDFVLQKRQTFTSETSTTRSQLRATLSIENHLASEGKVDTASTGCSGCETVSQSVNSIKKEMAKLWRRDSTDGQIKARVAALFPTNTGGSQILRTENNRLKAQNMNLMREVANLRRELEQSSSDKDSLVRIVCLLAKDKTSTVSSQELEVIDNVNES